MRLNQAAQLALVISVVGVCFVLFGYQLVRLSEDQAIPKGRHSAANPNANSNSQGLNFPLIVHHMWKTGSSPPPEMERWRKGCMTLNPEYKFNMYDDDQLLAFAQEHYPKYVPMMQALHGVCKFYVV